MISDLFNIIAVVIVCIGTVRILFARQAYWGAKHGFSERRGQPLSPGNRVIFVLLGVAGIFEFVYAGLRRHSLVDQRLTYWHIFAQCILTLVALRFGVPFVVEEVRSLILRREQDKVSVGIGILICIVAIILGIELLPLLGSNLRFLLGGWPT